MKDTREETAGKGTPRIAMIGCGAIAESFHLPALATQNGVLERVVLVDRDLDRARELGHRFGVTSVAADYQDVLGAVDGAIIAVPHHLHYPVASDCLKRGVHVLCEKPLAGSGREAAELAREAEDAGLTVSVNNNRRLFPSFQTVRDLIASNEMGPVERVEISHGEKFDWPSATGAYFGARANGKGVLLDTGAHILDLVCWWLGGKPELTSYADDSFGGAEAVAKLSFARGACRGQVHLSWLSRLKNVYRVEAREGTIEVEAYDWHAVRVVSRTGKVKKIQADSGIQTLSDVGSLVIGNFVGVLRSGRIPLVPGRDVALSLELIDECYASRSRFPMPWHDRFVRRIHDA